MPRCAWLLIGAITLFLHHTVGLPAVLAFTATALHWALTTPAVLVAIASLAGWHLLNYHAPRPPRRAAHIH